MLSKFQPFFDLVYDGDAVPPNNGKGSWSVDTNDYTNNNYAPGDYQFIIEATDKLGSTKKEKSFTWTLTDPCLPPTSQDIDQFTYTEYTIGKTE